MAAIKKILTFLGISILSIFITMTSIFIGGRFKLPCINIVDIPDHPHTPIGLPICFTWDPETITGTEGGIITGDLGMPYLHFDILLLDVIIWFFIIFIIIKIINAKRHR